ncbi:MAG TPA: cyclodeaminase/cyclohydrolase family protein [Candidatus Thermoplasmatota archaeon]|jgi:formiminotetrahydrofolate cyclodeaminase|nr:cyclodeaminase/cyclohydrolase family protein [Candidatus Thermoplasmatota archaeon]
MTKLVKQNVKMFLDEVASSSPAPGGGSVAALAGALGAALTSMVCNLTKAKQGYEAVQDQISEVLEKSEELRKDLTDLIDKDTDAFNEVMKALKMPKETEEQKEQRRVAMQSAFKLAAEVPLETARECVQILDVAHIVAEKGNKNSISDAAVSALMAQTGVQAAMLNVRINLSSIKDPDYVQQVSTELHELLQYAMQKSTEILSIVEKNL